MLKSKKGYIIKLRESRTFRGLSATVMLVLLFEVIQPTAALALTEGPSQPEVQSFEPISTTQMVDLFTGDFNYNIPLFNLPGPNGGYPFNLSYHAGISMDDEASWVGLGWNINAGSLVRNTRGLPDDFMSQLDAEGNYTSGDFLLTKNDSKVSTTLGATFGKSTEIVGANVGFNGYDLSLYYNNYRGIGVGLGISFRDIGNSIFSLGLSIDSENGLGLSPSISLPGRKESERSHSLGFSFNGQLSVNYSLTKQESSCKSKTINNSNTIDYYGRDQRSMGSSLAFANQNFIPSVGQKSSSYSLSFNLGKGKENTAGIYNGNKFGGFFMSQDLKDEEKNGIEKPVIGYAKLGSGSSANSKYYTKDFTRLNDKQINPSTNSLPYSFYTPDVYVSTGQGLSGYFRAQRNDVGHTNDPYVKNKTWGASVNIDLMSYTSTIEFTTVSPIQLPFGEIPIGTLLSIPANGNKIGIGGIFSFGWDQQSEWKGELNELSFDFNSPYVCSSENLYYKAFGESTIVANNTYSGINGTDLALVKFSDVNSDDLMMGKRKIEDAYNNIENSQNNSGQRIVRNTLIHNLSNEEVGYLGEFKFRYYEFNGSLNLFNNPSQVFDRNDRNNYQGIIKKHDAGFKVLNDDGAYYVYGLPAYNNVETENVFSVKNGNLNSNSSEADIELNSDGDEVNYKKNGTQKYISKSTKSPYAHSYLLTSIQGADYVDRTNDGPTQDDLGYWVKFDYVKYADNYKWRAPYSKASYNPGQNYTIEDDKASYQYGEKEIWYLARAETKTHIAIFDMIPRDDNKEAESEFSNSAGGLSDNLSGLKIRTIKLFDKKTFSSANPVPIQEVHFDYYDGSEELCKNSPNSQSTNGGKLTLKSVWFTNNGSTKGELNKYHFDYSTVDLEPQLSGLANLVNPDYSKNAYDSWGQYKPSTQLHSHNTNFPYVNQFNQGWAQSWMALYQGNQETIANKEVTKTAQDLLASAWCLRQIKLPSGGTIKIDYESDDYGYVQHKTANQMFKIVKVGESGFDNELYDETTDIVNVAETRRIYFKLENPIPASQNESETVYDDYVKPLIMDEHGERNLYFKTKIKLSNSENSYEYVSGYTPLENYSPQYYGADQEQLIDGTMKYTRGYVTLKVAKKKNGTSNFNYHPISLAAWTYLQSNAQDLLLNPNTTNSNEDGMTFTELMGQIFDIINIAPNVASSFGAVRLYLYSKLVASKIDLDNSCIRLASPDKIKFGGGHRVRNISIDDEWSSDTDNSENSRSYGQHFDYTINENGSNISSGVAQYEPQAGGDENALKYPITEYFKQGYFTNNTIFSEAPFNQSLFPSAQVGYRKVTVSSIHTNNRLKNESSNQENNSRTGGVVVHEYYTAKEFPTLWEYSYLSENNDSKDVFKLPIIIPLIGSIKREYFHGTQAYKIETNDMHGKIKSISSYEVNIDPSHQYLLNSSPITQQIYEYQCDPLVFQKENVFKLNNNVKVIQKGNHSISQIEQNKGLDVELFTDQRENKTFYNSIGLDFNFDFPIPNFAPAITFWPSYSNHKTLFRTFVTNKVVNRFGILKKVISKDLQSSSETENIAYDEKSGVPILTKIKNEFGDNFYSYNIPAYYEYDRMGHAYQNINYTTCSVQIHKTDDKGFNFEFNPSSDDLENLVRGDELLLSDNGYFKRAYFLGWKYVGSQVKGILNSGTVQILSDDFSSPMKVIRSGRRNHYSTMAANYLTIGKPSDLISSSNLQVDPNDTEITTPVLTDNVLSATANLYKDDWSTYEDNNLNSNLTTDNPFLTGNSGIWRPYKSYTYVGARKSNADLNNNNNSNNPKLYQDGVMSNVPMFTWDLGDIEDYISDWEWTNEITKFSSDAYELENVNRLDIYSSALYGYNSSLSIGVGGNATVNEIGVMDFESVYSTLYSFINVLTETNLNFDCNHVSGSVIIPEQFKVIKAISNTNSTIELYTNIPYSYYNSLNSQTNIGLSLVSRKNGLLSGNEGYYFNANAQSVVDNAGFAKIIVQPYFHSISSDKMLPTGGIYHGKITLLLNRPFKTISSGGVLVQSKFHTGKRSFKVTSETVFDQAKLKLKTNKKYIISLWVSRDNTNVKSLIDIPEDMFEIGVNVGNNFVVNTFGVKYTKSKIIEGWQKLDIEFTPQFENSIFAIKVKPGNLPVYIDDVRISPKTGGMSSYVYDPVKMRLVASLNVDNYATLFFYDEEGNLVLKKQETEKGIFTLTESRGHASSNN